MCYTIYLLYDGTSPDGRGIPEYVGKTTDKKKVVKHFNKIQDPHSIGRIEKLQGNDKFILTNLEDMFN